MSKFRIGDVVLIGTKYAKECHYGNIAGAIGTIVALPETPNEPGWHVRAKSNVSGMSMTMYVHTEDLSILGSENVSGLDRMNKEIEI